MRWCDICCEPILGDWGETDTGDILCAACWYGLGDEDDAEWCWQCNHSEAVIDIDGSGYRLCRECAQRAQEAAQ